VQGAILIGNPCFKYALLTANEQEYLPEYIFVNDVVMDFDELYDLSIPNCPVEFTCSHYSTDNGVDHLQCDDGHLAYDADNVAYRFSGILEEEQDKFPPGTYTVHLQATPGGNPDHMVETSYSFTIPELCQSYVLEQFEPIVQQPMESFVMFHNDQSRVTYYNENRFFTTNPRVECGVWQVDYFLRVQDQKVSQDGLNEGKWFMVDSGESSYVVWFTPSEPEDWGTYTFSVRGSVPNVPGYEMESSFTVIFANREQYCTPVVPMEVPISREHCVTAIKDEFSGIAGKPDWMQTISDISLTNLSTFSAEYGPCVDMKNRPMSCKWVLGNASKFCTGKDTTSPGGLISLHCDGKKGEYIDDGWWLITIIATNELGEYKQSFALDYTYAMTESTTLAMPSVMFENQFEGTILKTYPTVEGTEPEKTIQPFVKSLSQDNVLSLGFDEPVQSHNDHGVAPVALGNLRKLKKIHMFNEQNVRFQDVYDVVNPIEVTLSSTEMDEDIAPAVHVDWTMQSSSENGMEIKLLLDRLAEELDISNYDDVSVTFNNPKMFKPANESSEKVLPVGKNIHMKLDR